MKYKNYLFIAEMIVIVQRTRSTIYYRMNGGPIQHIRNTKESERYLETYTCQICYEPFCGGDSKRVVGIPCQCPNGPPCCYICLEGHVNTNYETYAGMQFIRCPFCRERVPLADE